MNLTGGCACGAIRYSIEAPPIRSFQCHCRDCQRDTGGGHSSVMVVATAAVHIDGDVKEVLRQADSGKNKRKGFCGNCGSPIYNKPETQPHLMGIYAGSLDDASDFRPSIILFSSRRYGWDHIDPALPQLPNWYERPN